MEGMTASALLIGIVLAAALFAALLWSIYRIFETERLLRLNYIILSLSTVMIVAAVTWNLAGITVTAGLTCAITALVALVADKGWSKLLPLVQFAAGAISLYAGSQIII